MAVILIVEDEVFIREVAEMTLADLGYDIFSATDVEEALTLLRSPQRFDVLFTDIRLKADTFGGYELARQAIMLRPSIRVLYTTSIAANDDPRARVVDGARFLEKPYAPHQLQGAVEDLLAPGLNIA